MKKLLFIFGLVTASLVSAQAKGTYEVETTVLSNNTFPNTGLGFSKVDDGASTFNVGATGGYFIMDDLAVKLGAGYGVTRYDNRILSEGWAFKAGAEYAIIGKVPVEVAWVGTSVSGLDKNPSYVTAQVGYNWYVAPNVIVKPLVRRDFSTTDYYKSQTHVGAGIVYLFN